MFVISIIVALMAASLPATRVFAAPASDSENGDWAQEWSIKTRNVRFHNLFYTQVRLFPADFKDLSDLARAHELLDKYGAALRQANAIILAHAGFDAKGHVVNEELAAQSVRGLAENLRTMRVVRAKIKEEGYKLHLAR